MSKKRANKQPERAVVIGVPRFLQSGIHCTKMNSYRTEDRGSRAILVISGTHNEMLALFVDQRVVETTTVKWNKGPEMLVEA